jgi:hypothetical protein
MAARVKREDAPIAFGRRGLEPDPRHVPDDVWGQHDATGGFMSLDYEILGSQFS